MVYVVSSGQHHRNHGAPNCLTGHDNSYFQPYSSSTTEQNRRTSNCACVITFINTQTVYERLQVCLTNNVYKHAYSITHYSITVL